MRLAARTKQLTAGNLQKLCAHRDPIPTFVPDREYKVDTLYSGTGTVPEFYACLHISAQRVPYSGTKYECCLIVNKSHILALGVNNPNKWKYFERYLIWLANVKLFLASQAKGKIVLFFLRVFLFFFYFYFFRFYNTIMDLKITILSTVFLYLKMVLWEAYNNKSQRCVIW